MLLFELDFEEVSKKKLRECWSQLCRIRCTVAIDSPSVYVLVPDSNFYEDCELFGFSESCNVDQCLHTGMHIPIPKDVIGSLYSIISSTS